MKQVDFYKRRERNMLIFGIFIGFFLGVAITIISL